MTHVHRLSNRFKDFEAEHLKLMLEAIANGRELLKLMRPDTFAGRKTQEPFPKARPDAMSKAASGWRIPPKKS